MKPSISYTLVRLRFENGFHLSSGKEGNYDRSQLRLHSDTLKSALFVSALKLYGKDTVGMKNVEKGNEGAAFFDGFRLSSAFPYYEHRHGIDYFFPRPALNLAEQLIMSEDFGSKAEKERHNIEFIEHSTLRDLLREKITVEQVKEEDKTKYQECIKELKRQNQSKEMIEECERIMAQIEKKYSNKYLLAGKYLLKGTIVSEEMTKTAMKQQVMVQPEGEDALPFGVDQLHFSEGAGLYVLMDIRDETLVAQVKAAWELLGEEGLGTDRSTGGGSFSPKIIDNYPLELPPSATRQMNLSLYWPRQNEALALAEEGAAYQLQRRGGYMAQPANDNHLSIRKRSVYMVTEGSVFSNQHSLEGRLGDLRPDSDALTKAGIPIVDHPVWRDGQALFLPL
ncbi:type III-A CRISPR-associated RAMP protein Csm4 [Lewinella sp. LCG006]|uniref:type III-A CRISPR-associated RAMP protein Csm4 n=1 Tax=Lewinella sp. LCG006 TaxID=3231911 RepID=UPI00345F900D